MILQVAVWHCADDSGGEAKLAGKLDVTDSVTAIHAAPVQLSNSRWVYFNHQKQVNDKTTIGTRVFNPMTWFYF